MTAKELQKQVGLSHIEIIGVEDWHDVLPKELDLSHGGFGTLPIDDALQTFARVNGSSFERALVGLLLSKGCQLEELVIQCSNHPEWGMMYWLKEHPTYNDPVTQDELRFFDRPENFKANFWRAMFNTSGCGLQHHSLYSMAMNAQGLHKSFVYHKVVLSPPIL